MTAHSRTFPTAAQTALEVRAFLHEGRLAAARARLRASRDPVGRDVRTLVARRTDAVSAGWAAACAAMDVGQRATARGHLEILRRVARDWRGPGGLLAAEALLDLDRFHRLAAAAPSFAVSRHAVDRYIERIDGEAGRPAARAALEELLVEGVTVSGRPRRRHERAIIRHPRRPELRGAARRVGRRDVLLTVLPPE